MHKTIVAFGLGCALLAGCAGTTETKDNRSAYEEAYIPTGSNIPRKDPKRADVPAVTSAEQMTILRAGQIQKK